MSILHFVSSFSANPRRARLARCFAAALFLLLAALAPAAAQDAPAVTLAGDITDAGELRIGGHLDIILAGEPFRRYDLVLVDESEDKVASAYSVAADEKGDVEAFRLWTRTGVVGCDAGVVYYPAAYGFKLFDDAEAVLDGRDFKLWVIDSGSTALLEEIEVPLVVDLPPIEAYPSDGAGCLVTDPQQDIYLSVTHQAGIDLWLQVYVVNYQETWNLGDPLVDVSPGGEQWIQVPAGADPHVELLWPLVPVGRYQVILRTSGDTPGLQLTDIVVDPGCSGAGSTFRECPGVCP